MHQFKAFNFFPGSFNLVYLGRCVVLLMILFLSVEGYRKNYVTVNSRCDDSAIYLDMNFTRPFNGIIHTVRNTYNPACSYPVSPLAQSLTEVNLTIPYRTCGVKGTVYENKNVAVLVVLISFHRLLDTTSDQVCVIRCELPPRIRPRTITDPNITTEDSGIRANVDLKLGAGIYPEHIARSLEIDDKLLITYNLRDYGMYKNMTVMSCIGHDGLIINRRTRIYQIYGPLGCPSDADKLSNFTVIRNSETGFDLTAYAQMKNISLVIKKNFYITCSAFFCKDDCPDPCSDMAQKSHLVYISDVSTKGLANTRRPARIPASLAQLDSNERSTRSSDFIQSDEQLETLSDEVFNLTGNEGNSSSNNSDFSAPRSKRAIELKEPLSTKLNVIFINSDTAGNVLTYNLAAINTNITLPHTSNVSLQSFLEHPRIAPNKLNDKNLSPKFKIKLSNADVTKIHFKPLSPLIICILQAFMIFSALFCISGVCYSVLFVRRRTQAFSVSDYMQSYL